MVPNIQTQSGERQIKLEQKYFENLHSLNDKNQVDQRLYSNLNVGLGLGNYRPELE
jgi:hypothetical protein